VPSWNSLFSLLRVMEFCLSFKTPLHTSLPGSGSPMEFLCATFIDSEWTQPLQHDLRVSFWWTRGKVSGGISLLLPTTNYYSNISFLLYQTFGGGCSLHPHCFLVTLGKTCLLQTGKPLGEWGVIERGTKVNLIPNITQLD
jgi:hypothetical protein